MTTRCTPGTSTGPKRGILPCPARFPSIARDDGVTFYEFDQPGDFLYACHLPGHVAYGMFGNITVVPRRA